MIWHNHPVLGCSPVHWLAPAGAWLLSCQSVLTALAALATGRCRRLQVAKRARPATFLLVFVARPKPRRSLPFFALPSCASTATAFCVVCALCAYPVLSLSVFRGCVCVMSQCFLCPVWPQSVPHSATKCPSVLGEWLLLPSLSPMTHQWVRQPLVGFVGLSPNPSLPHRVHPGYTLCPCSHYN
jgi:hypothetical protein